MSKASAHYHPCNDKKCHQNGEDELQHLAALENDRRRPTSDFSRVDDLSKQ